MRLNLILRTAICLEVGLVITFSQVHNVTLGLQSLTSFGVGYAMITIFVALLQRKKLASYQNLPITGLALVVGLIAAQAPTTGGMIWFRLLVAGWGVLSGCYEIWLASKASFRSMRGKEQLLTGLLGLILGALYLLVPLSEIDAVGFFGAYLIISAVHLGIAAASERPTKTE